MNVMENEWKKGDNCAYSLIALIGRKFKRGKLDWMVVIL